MTCRNCQAGLHRVFVDLGTSPLSNAYLSEVDLDQPEPHFPLRPYVCDKCLLVQLPVFESPETIFGGDYAFFSGQSATWVDHCSQLMRLAAQRLRLTRESRVLEIASNDGTLLRAALRWTSRVTGVEPAGNVARHALLQGLPTIHAFFTARLGQQLAAGGYQADLIVANNVLAHVPDLDDFLRGVRHALAPEGTLILEVPSLARLVRDNQFDTIYHEHFSYFSLCTLQDVLRRRGFGVTDVEMMDTHGGSLRVFARHTERARPLDRVADALDADWVDLGGYEHQPADLRQRVLEMLTQLRHEGRRIAGYGAPAKATTFLTYCGIDHETIEFIVDSTPAKQGLYQPGARIPILPERALQERKPDVVVILPWNWRAEILAKIERECPWRPMVICRDEVLQDGALAAAA